MTPTLEPGDWLLVDPDAFKDDLPVRGDLVLAPDPREGSRLLVKRVVDVDDRGRLTVAGDNAAESSDSRAFGAIDQSALDGRPWFRYWPLRRWGRIS
jgi:signal peptidase I